MASNLVTRLVVAVVSGLIAGVITALLLWVLAQLVPALTLDPGTWGTVVGVLVAIVTFVTGRERVW